MCLIAFSFDPAGSQPIMLAANRDEFFSRPTQDPRWWPDQAGVFGGRDSQAGGTWMAVFLPGHHQHAASGTLSRTCRFAALTNVRGAVTHSTTGLNIASNQGAPESRGHLVTRLLKSELSLESTMRELAASDDRYDGYNLIGFEWQENQSPDSCDQIGVHELKGWHLSNSGPYRHRVMPLEPGIHGVSNGAFNEDWPKTTLLTGAVKEAMTAHGQAAADKILLSALKNAQVAQEALLPKTGIGTATERELSMPFIRTRFDSSGEQATYGTRTSTLFNLSDAGRCRFQQISWDSSALTPTLSAVREMQSG